MLVSSLVNYSDAHLSRMFAASADPARWAMLSALEREPDFRLSELARPLPIKLPGVMKHVGVFTDAGLATCMAKVRALRCQITPAPMADAQAWLDRHLRLWEKRLYALKAVAEDDRGLTAEGKGGIFHNVDPPCRLQLNWRWTESTDPDSLSDATSLITFDLAPEGKSTSFTLTHEQLPDQAQADSHEEGGTWHSTSSRRC